MTDKKPATKKASTAKHYIDNAKFYEEIMKYWNVCQENKTKGIESPRVSNYLGDCFVKLADNLGNLDRFRNYIFLDNMKSDAVYCCLKYMYNFDPNKSKNPFGYFTKVSYFAFLRRIQEEKKNLYKKYKAIENTEIFEFTADTQGHDATVYAASEVKYSEHSREKMVEFIQKFEAGLKAKKLKKDEKNRTPRTD